MSKLQSSQILKPDATLSAKKLESTDASVNKFIEETKLKQAEVLKLKEVDQSRLRTIVQL